MRERNDMWYEHSNKFRNSQQVEVDSYYPNRLALQYWNKILTGLLKRVEETKAKIATLEQSAEQETSINLKELYE